MIATSFLAGLALQTASAQGTPASGSTSTATATAPTTAIATASTANPTDVATGTATVPADAGAIDPEGSLVDSLGKTWNLGDNAQPLVAIGDHWHLARYDDLLTGRPASTLLLPGEAKISGSTGHVVPTLLVNCFDDAPAIMIHVRFAPEVELIDLGFAYTTVYVQLDDGRQKRVLMQRSKDSQYLIFEKPGKWFDELMQTDSLRIRYTPFNYSPQVMKFDTSTFDEVVPQNLACFTQ